MTSQSELDLRAIARVTHMMDRRLDEISARLTALQREEILLGAVLTAQEAKREADQ
jgi:hypothetical protein